MPASPLSSLATLSSAQREELKNGIVDPKPLRLDPPLRLCRFTDTRYGADEGLVSPWWIAESDFLKITAARERSRAQHGGDKFRALSLGFLARWATAVPQEWQHDGKHQATTMDLLLRGDLLVSMDAFVGRGRVQRETSPNGIDIKWSGWSSVTQIYIPSFSRKPPVGATPSEVFKVMAVGAPTYVVSRALYSR